MKPLTRRQREILEYVLSHRERMGRTPTGTEIARHFRFQDHSTAYQHLRAIARKGYLEIVQPTRRGVIALRLSETARRLLRPAWPLLGRIPAGPLSETDEQREEIERLEDLLPDLRPGDYFLVVEGDSMIEAGLLPGQYVVVRPERVPKEGDICAVWIEGEGGTLKRVAWEGETVRLIPANSHYSEQRYPAERVRIQGVVVAAVSTQSFKE